MNQPIRLGVIGVGRRWRRIYRPALLAVPERFSIRAIYDQVFSRASREARQLTCSVAEGPTSLLERRDLDALLLADHQWFGLWPVEVACRLGKAVLCGDVFGCSDPHLESLSRSTQSTSAPVAFALGSHFRPAGIRLGELCRTELGPARFLLCDRVSNAPLHRPAGNQVVGPSSIAALIGAAGISCLDYGAWLLGDASVSAATTWAVGQDFGTLCVEYSERRSIQITGRRLSGVRPSLQLRVLTELASITLQSPQYLCWTDRGGRHSQFFRADRPWGQVVLEHFWNVVRGRAAPQAGLAEACRISTWLRAAEGSQEHRV